MTEPTDERPPRRLTPFLPTRQHRRFVEFADAVRRHRYIGACYGAPGLGKTLSARTYAAADDWDRWALHRYSGRMLPQSLLDSRTAIFTPYVTITARQLLNEVIHRVPSSRRHRTFLQRPWDPFDDIPLKRTRAPNCYHRRGRQAENQRPGTAPGLLRPQRHRHHPDRHARVRRQLARYPQLYSRVGFAHQYRPLDPKTSPTFSRTTGSNSAYRYDPTPADAESANTVARITGGNFRLIERLMSQVARVLKINQLDTITPEVVEAARSAGRRRLTWPDNSNKVSHIT